MKKFSLALFLVVLAVTAFAQRDTMPPPYKRFPAFPPVKLLLPDSATWFTKQDLQKKKPVMLMIFNPQCDHCQHETEAITKNIDQFKNIHIIMSTSMPFDSMMQFRERYQLAAYKNITVGQDTHFFLPTFYMLHNMPFLAFYDKKHQLISVFEGSLPVPAILKVFND